MATKPPPVPRDNQSSKGPGDRKEAARDETRKARSGAPDPDKQGQQGNTKVNTTHQGYQQDR
jgi:hypothetical protein